MLRKLLALAAFVSLTGCASLGDVEALNDFGRSGKAIGSALRTINSTCAVTTGHYCGTQLNTPAINTTYGQVKQLPYHIKDGQPAQKISETLNVFQLLAPINR